MPEGEIAALIGPNGTGKTTPFNFVSGLLRPSAGSIRVGDREIGALPAHRIARLGLGRTFQTPRPFLDLTAADDVAAAARWAERPGGTPREAPRARGNVRAAARATAILRHIRHEGEVGRGASLARSRARRYSRPEGGRWPHRPAVATGSEVVAKPGHHDGRDHRPRSRLDASRRRANAAEDRADRDAALQQSGGRPHRGDAAPGPARPRLSRRPRT